MAQRAHVPSASSAARTMLPTGMRQQIRLIARSNPTDAPVMILALTSTTLNKGSAVRLASTVLAQKISQLSG